MRVTVVSGSGRSCPLQLTRLFLWESKSFYSSVTRYSDLNRLCQPQTLYWPHTVETLIN